MNEDLQPADVAVRADALMTEIERAIVGKRAAVRLVVIAMLAGGHVLIEDVPGLGKTQLARSLAASTRSRFTRVQFTPDLLPGDLTGTWIYDQGTGETRFRPGPVFTNLLLADEINRAPPKTQAALLEAMQERQVTGDDGTRPLPDPFLVIATQNPIEFDGTYPLPEAELDRFAIRIELGYPSADDEREMLRRRNTRMALEPTLRPVIDLRELRAMQACVNRVHVDADIECYVVDLVRATRASDQVRVGASPRAALALMQLARAAATVAGRSFVVPDDVKPLTVPALAHRLSLPPELWVRRVTAADVVRDCVDAVPAPATIPGGVRA
jgi:MoxR-like ATPase